MINTVFVGGTGRSGSNALCSALLKCPGVVGPEFETRYIVDPNGVAPFLRNLERGPSPFECTKLVDEHVSFLSKLSRRGRLARAINPIIKSVPGNKKEKLFTGPSYADWELEKYFPGYDERLRDYVGWLERRSYRAVWPGYRGFSLFPRMYFAGSDDIATAYASASDFVTGNIEAATRDSDARLYVDDNTFNLLYATTIEKLVPGCKFLHIKRNPLDIVASYRQQRWCPADPVLAADIVVDLLKKIKGELALIDRDRVLEVSLENLVGRDSISAKNLAAFIGCEDAQDYLPLSYGLANIGRGEREFDESQKEKLKDRFGPLLHE